MKIFQIKIYNPKKDPERPKDRTIILGCELPSSTMITRYQYTHALWTKQNVNFGGWEACDSPHCWFYPPVQP